jgi:hypothetical protein
MWWKRLTPATRLDERGGPVDRAVDVALGGEVHDRVGGVLDEDLRDPVDVADVGLLEAQSRAVGDRLGRAVGGRVGHLVDVDDLVIGVVDQVAHDGGADEPLPAGDEDLHPFGHRDVPSSRCSRYWP